MNFNGNVYRICRSISRSSSTIFTRTPRGVQLMYRMCCIIIQRGSKYNTITRLYTYTAAFKLKRRRTEPLDTSTLQYNYEAFVCSRCLPLLVDSYTYGLVSATNHWPQVFLQVFQVYFTANLGTLLESQ